MDALDKRGGLPSTSITYALGGNMQKLIKNSPKKAKLPSLKLVEVHGKKLTTTSLIIAKEFQRTHKNVIQSIEKLIADSTLTGLDFKPSQYVDLSGKPNKMYILTERGFLIALPFIGGQKSRQGQIKLVDAFLKYQKLLNEPGRQKALKLKRDSHKLMMDVKQVILEKEGFPVTTSEFIKENLFVNRALNGKWAAIPEPEYGTYEAELMANIRDFNTYLIVKYGKKQDARKQALSDFVDEYRAKHPRDNLIQEPRATYQVGLI